MQQISELTNIVSADGQSAQRFPGGISLPDPPEVLRDEWFYGVVVNVGPEGDADFTDSRYWVCELSPVQAANAVITDITRPYTSFFASARWVVATNFAEAANETHSLPVITLPEVGSAIPAGATIVRVRMVDSLKLSGDVDNDRANTIYLLEPIASPSAPDGFWVRIASSSPVTDQPNHYVYTGQRQIPYTPGLWQDDPDNATPVTAIYNTMEANNSDSGVQGNGTDLADYPDGTTIPPLRGNPVLWCRPGVDCYGNPEYWVSAPNAAPVVCGGS
jgi:hypothetical protein